MEYQGFAVVLIYGSTFLRPRGLMVPNGKKARIMSMSTFYFKHVHLDVVVFCMI